MYLASLEHSGIDVPGTDREPGDHFYVDGDSTVRIHHETTCRFQLIAPSVFTGAIRASKFDNPNVTGVILSPTPVAVPSQFITRDGELFGAVVTRNLTVEKNAEVHLDCCIEGEEIPFGNDSLFDFLHDSENNIEVRD